MSTDDEWEEVSLYIQRLKTHLHVRTDEQLATKLGMSKQNISNWRRRGSVPARVAKDIQERYGIEMADKAHGFDNRLQMGIVYASALYSVSSYLKDKNLEGEDWQKLGDAFYYFVGAIRSHVREHKFPVRDATSLTNELLAEDDGRGLYYLLLERFIADGHGPVTDENEKIAL